MNILILDKDPEKAAEYHSDRHVLNYIVTYSQFLSSVHWFSLWVNDKDSKDSFEKLTDMKVYLDKKYPEGNEKRPPYGINYLNNPCLHWICETKQNYVWLCKLLESLCRQYQYRYGKIHKCQNNVSWFKENIPVLCEDKEITNFYIHVPETYKVSEHPVECYRKFYVEEKKEKAKYRKGNYPYWL